jgi:diacylglycerol kinase family enzyme
LPAGAVVARGDAGVRAILEAARREGRAFPVVGLLGGDLARTLGAATPDGGDAAAAEARLRSDAAVRFPVDVGEVLIDGRVHYFVAHLVARTATWSYAFVAMNAQWLGPWNMGPRAHPGDGLLDTYEGTLGWSDRFKVRSRLHHGAHLPHPRISERRASAVQVSLPKPLPVRLDGEVVGEGRELSLRVMPDALTVVV